MVPQQRIVYRIVLSNNLCDISVTNIDIKDCIKLYVSYVADLHKRVLKADGVDALRWVKQTSWSSSLKHLAVNVLLIVISKLLKRHSNAKRRAPAYSRALRQIRG